MTGWSRIRTASWAVFITASIVTGATASAQPPDRDEAARERFDTGTRLYAQGRYLEAAAAFQDAYDLSQRPLILLNLSTAYERALDLGRAANVLEHYLEVSNPNDEAELRERLERLRALAASSDPPPNEPVETPVPNPNQVWVQPNAAPVPSPQQNAITGPRVGPPPEIEQPVEEPTPFPVLGVVSASLGLLALISTGIAVVSGLQAVSNQSALEDGCTPERVCPGRLGNGESSQDQLSDGEDLALAADVTGAIGAVLGTTAGILLILALTQGNDSSETTVAPAVDGNGAGISVFTSF
ncbi:MAG: tetratricopeptide repeat protein [Myxococcota bacterium]